MKGFIGRIGWGYLVAFTREKRSDIRGQFCVCSTFVPNRMREALTVHDTVRFGGTDDHLP